MPCLNLDLDYFDHPKTVRLVGLLGKGSEVLPIRLWAYAGKYHAKDGKLADYSAQAIESAVRWWGRPGELVNALTDIGFLGQDEKGFFVHDWNEHQGHIWSLSQRNKKIATNRWKKIRNQRSEAQILDEKVKVPVVYQNCTSGVPQPTNQLTKQQTMAGPVKELAQPPPEPEPKKPRKESDSPIHGLVRVYKYIKGIPQEDKSWDKAQFGRCSRRAKSLLEAFNGNGIEATNFMADLAKKFDEMGLTWGFETIEKHAWDTKGEREGHGATPGEVGANRSLGTRGPIRVAKTRDLVKSTLARIKSPAVSKTEPGNMDEPFLDGEDG